MKGFYTGRTIWTGETRRGMILLTNGRGVTLRTAWVEDSDEGADNPYRTDNEPGDLSCPSCGAPLRKKMSGKAFCWFCEREFELDSSGSIVDDGGEEEEDDFEMDLEISKDDDEEDEEMEFDIEIDVDEEEYEGEEEEEVDFEMEEGEIEEDEDVDFDLQDEESEEEEELEWDEEEIEEDIEVETEEDDVSFSEGSDPASERKRRRRLGSTEVEFD